MVSSAFPTGEGLPTGMSVSKQEPTFRTDPNWGLNLFAEA